MNRQSNRAVIIAHENWSGGKFIIACLSMSDQCGFQDPKSFLMTKEQKFSHFQNEFDLLNNLWTDGVYQPGTWSDFRMGNGLLMENTTMFADITNGSKYFFINCHTADELSTLLGIWTNSTVILLNNTKNFVYWRKNIQNPIFDYDSMMTQLQNLFNKYNNRKLNFDGNAFLDKSKFIDQIAQLYQGLRLEDFNQTLITELYQTYIKTLDHLKWY